MERRWFDTPPPRPPSSPHPPGPCPGWTPMATDGLLGPDGHTSLRPPLPSSSLGIGLMSDENQPACIRNISKEKSDVPRKSFLTSHMDTYFLLLTMRCVECKRPLRGRAILESSMVWTVRLTVRASATARAPSGPMALSGMRQNEGNEGKTQ